MRVIVLYRPNSDHERMVLDYARDYKMLKGDRDLELVSLDTREGADMAKLYGIMQYPAVLAMSNDGQMQQLWQGESLPLLNEVDYFAHS